MHMIYSVYSVYSMYSIYVILCPLMAMFSDVLADVYHIISSL